MLKHRASLVSVLITSVSLFFSIVTSAAPLPFEEPLSEKYLRIEVVVDKDFSATCKSQPGKSTCRVSSNSTDLLRVYGADLKSWIKVNHNKSRREYQFSFQDPKIKLQDKVLDGPPRWVIEIGYEETLLRPVEEELPFRPYPMPAQTVQLERPSIAVKPISGETPDVVEFNKCYSLWEQNKLRSAWVQCRKVSGTSEASDLVRASVTRLKAEIVYQHLKRLSRDEQKGRAYVNQYLFYLGDRINLTAGQPTELRYSISGDAGSATLSILNSDGQQVYEKGIELKQSGRVHKVEWPGVDNTNSELPTGVYTVVITPQAAPDAKELPTAQTYVRGLVTAFRVIKGLPMLTIDGQTVNQSSIIDPKTEQVGTEKPKEYFYMENPEDHPRDKAIELLQRAQAASQSERERARYILLASDVKYERYPNEAIEYLRKMQGRFPQADPYILAERVRLLLQIGSDDEAKRVLDQISQLDKRYELVMGSRLIALASLAYSKRDYVDATKLYDDVVKKYTGLLTKDPGPLFRTAELYFLAGRHKEAKVFYQEFLNSYANEFPSWIARLRLTQLNSYINPKEAEREMIDYGQSMEEPEGKQLAQLYSLTLSSNSVHGPSPETVFKNIGENQPTQYVQEELLMQKAKYMLSKGDVESAFNYSQQIVEELPDSSLLRTSSLFFQRVLLLQVDKLLREGRGEELFVLFLKEKGRRFREPDVRALLHLYVAKATRDLRLLEIAIKDVISQGGLPAASKVPRIDALLRLELTGLYRELIQEGELEEDEARTTVNQFKQLVEALQKGFRDEFDSYDYWASLGYYHELEGDLRKAKQIYLYALNGPNMSPKERLELGESIYNVYMKIPDHEKALHALKVLLLIHDEYRDQLNMPTFRAKTLWKRVELCIQLEDWPSTVKGIKEYLAESQSLLSALQTEQMNTEDQKRREELIFHTDLDAQRRREALFYHGYALLKIGLVRQAKKQWDLLYKEAPDDVYGTLAEEELRMLSWRETVSPEVLKAIDATQ